MRTKLMGLLIALAILTLNENAFAYVIIAVEQGAATYRADENKTSKDIGRYKTYFEVDETNKIVKRIKVVLLTDDPLGDKKGQVRPDNTIYQIIEPSQLSILKNEKVIHAIGQPGINATELLTISKDHVMQSKSTGDYVVLVNSKIIERSDVPDEPKLGK